MNTVNDKKMLVIRIDPKLYEKLRKLAFKSHVSQTRLVEEAIKILVSTEFPKIDLV